MATEVSEKIKALQYKPAGNLYMLGFRGNSQFNLVSLRGPSAKHFWDGLERFGAQLEEFDIRYTESKVFSPINLDG